jgi:hypothetical protein
MLVALLLSLCEFSRRGAGYSGSTTSASQQPGLHSDQIHPPLQLADTDLMRCA